MQNIMQDIAYSTGLQSQTIPYILPSMVMHVVPVVIVSIKILSLIIVLHYIALVYDEVILDFDLHQFYPVAVKVFIKSINCSV